MGLKLKRLEGPNGAIAVLDYEPRHPRGVTIVAGHGYAASKHSLDPLCSLLAGHGYRMLSLDFPGHKLGASEGRLDSLEDLTDAMAVVVAFARRTYGGPILTLGHSMGAVTAVRVCSEDPAIAGTISIALGLARLNENKASTVDLRSIYVDGIALKEIATQHEQEFGKILGALAERPSLYIAGTRDDIVPCWSVQELYESAPEPKSYVRSRAIIFPRASMRGSLFCIG